MRIHGNVCEAVKVLGSLSAVKTGKKGQLRETFLITPHELTAEQKQELLPLTQDQLAQRQKLKPKHTVTPD